MKLTVDFYVMQAMYQLAADRRQERQKERFIAKVCVQLTQERRHSYIVFGAIEDAYSKDDICVSHSGFIEDAYSKDDICVSRLEFIEDAYSKDDICIEYIEYPRGTGNT